MVVELDFNGLETPNHLQSEPEHLTRPAVDVSITEVFQDLRLPTLSEEVCSMLEG